MRIVFALLWLPLLLQGQIIDQRISERYKTNDEVSYLISFHRSEIPKSKAHLSKERKAQFVFDHLKTDAEKSQQEVLEFLRKEGIQHRSYFISNAVFVRSDRAIFDRVKTFGGIKRITWDEVYKVADVTVEENIQTRMPEPEWGLLKIGADRVWERGYTGQGAVVGGQDTGYDWRVSPLYKKYRGFVSDTSAVHDYNWHDAIHEHNPMWPDTTVNPCGLDVLEPCDDHNHGTHTMGTMVGSDDDNAIGVAPGAQWMACRNMDRGYGSPSTYLECFEWFLAPTDLNGQNPDPSKAPHVINNSWSCPEVEGCNPMNWDILETAVNNLRASGVVVVVSAGNSGSDCGTVSTPAAMFEGSFSVGATRINDTIAGFSSRGPVTIDSSYRLKPDISAPGHNVRSVVRNGQFRNYSGTSMAGPHVAGLVALLISANPALAGEVETIEDIIRRSAFPRYSDQECDGISGQDIPNAVYGYGRIDANRAIDLALGYDKDFGPVGGQWIYEYAQFSGPNGINTITVVGDTLINNKRCRVLRRPVTSCDFLSEEIFVHQEANRVYVYNTKDDSLHLVYDFNRNTGEEYIASYADGQFDNSYLLMHVDSIGFIESEGVSYPAQFVTPTLHFDFGPNGQDTLVLNPRVIGYPFGDIGSLFSEELLICDGTIHYQLNCYFDDQTDLHLNGNEACGIVSTKDLSLKETMVFPNPARFDIRLTEPGVRSYQIYNASGTLVKSGTTTPDASIDVSDLNVGIYMLFFEDMQRSLKFVKL